MIKDDYNAKYKIWAKENKVWAIPQMILPFKIKPQRFDSYEEMNAWKKQLLIDIAKHGGVKWSK